jgi:4-amino-4-deoxy-L-arabinose transferase-like glycosyltransferase
MELPAVSAPGLAKRSSRRAWVRVWGPLTGVLLIAAVLRFWRLDAQAYWTDEAYTIGRIKGTFDYLMLRLADQGFPPGWYVLLRGWCLWVEKATGDGAFAFSPTSTRGLTALLGTLTVPGMYLLGRAFFDRRGALLVALLAAVNPFLIYYSRDIKMYGALLCFCVWNAAFFFRWMETQKHWAYAPLFAVTGVLMTAMQSMAWMLVALELLFLLTRRKLRPLDGPLWMAGVSVMALIPIYWYSGRTIYLERLNERGADMSLLWITRYTDMSWKTVAGLPTEQLLGFLWPVYPPDARIEDWFSLRPDFDAHLATRSWEWLASLEWWGAAGLLVLLFAGLIPWRRMARRKVHERSVGGIPGMGRRWWIAVWVAAPSAALALTWIPKDSPWHERVWHGLTVQPIWEPRYLAVVAPGMVLWLAVALRNLPTRVVRVGASAVVVAACAGSAVLANQLTYRNAPLHRAAEIAARYAEGGTFERVAIGNPALSFLGEVDAVSYPLALRKRPDPTEVRRTARNGGIVYRLGAVPNGRELPADPYSTQRFLRLAKVSPEVEAIVLTDRNGDLSGPEDVLSDASVGRILGEEWKLVQTERYAWHYEWRPYLFHVWRTRVWVRKGAEALPK